MRVRVEAGMLIVELCFFALTPAFGCNTLLSGASGGFEAIHVEDIIERKRG